MLSSHQNALPLFVHNLWHLIKHNIYCLAFVFIAHVVMIILSVDKRDEMSIGAQTSCLIILLCSSLTAMIHKALLLDDIVALLFLTYTLFVATRIFDVVPIPINSPSNAAIV